MGLIADIKDIFKRFYSGSMIFRDRSVLRHDFIPDKLPCREKEIEELASILAPALRGELPSNVFIYGKPGTGKTVVVRYVLTELMDAMKELKVNYVRLGYTNCRRAGTPYRVLSELCDTIDVKVPFTGLATDEVFTRFKKGLERKRCVFIAVLDEIDALIRKNRDAGNEVLYRLTRINVDLKKSKVCFIGITNDVTLNEYLDGPVLSCLSERELVFPPYDATQLSIILRERAKLAFREGVVSEDAIKVCAALAAREHGDARKALDLLRVAGEIAERKGDSMVSEEHVLEAQKELEYGHLFEAIKKLPLHSRLVLLSVYLLEKRTHKIFTGDVYSKYEDICSMLDMSPLSQRRVSELINELDSMGILNVRVVSMGRYGRSKKISIACNKKVVRDVLSGDEWCSVVLNP